MRVLVKPIQGHTHPLSRHLTADCAYCAASTIKIVLAINFELAETVLRFCPRSCLCRGNQSLSHGWLL